MLIRFEGADGGIYEIHCPTSVDEITFNAFCDFKGAERVWLTLCTEDDNTAAVKQLVRTLGFLIPGDLRQVPLQLEGDPPPADLIDKGFSIFRATELSIFRLYAHLLTLINRYEPTDIPEVFTADVAGQTYEIHQGRAAAVLLNRPMNVGEFIECAEWQRVSNIQLDRLPDQAANIDFTLGLTELAILLRKPGEELPADKGALSAFLAERRKLFQTVTLDVVLSIRFFLLNTLLAYATTPSSNTSGKVRHAQASKRPKRKRLHRNGRK